MDTNNSIIPIVENNMEQSINKTLTVAKTITSLHQTNFFKQYFLNQHFEEIKVLKNNVSQKIHEYILKNGIKTIYDVRLADFRKQFKNAPIDALELQGIISNISDHYISTIDRLTKNHKFYSHFITISSFSIPFTLESNVKQTNPKTRKEKKACDSKFCYNRPCLTYLIEDKKGQSIFSNLLNYIKYIKPEQLQDYRIQIPEEPDTSNLNEKKAEIALEKWKKKCEMYKVMDEQLFNIQNNKWMFQRVFNTISLLQERIFKKLKVNVYNTGSYKKVAMYNKNSEKPTLGSYVLKDKTNKKYQYWYAFKINKDISDYDFFSKENTINYIHIPLAYNDEYHAQFRDIDLRKEHYISLTSNTNRLKIGLTYEKEDMPIWKEHGSAVYVDLNVRDNFLSFADEVMIDYDRKYIKEFVDELIKFDKLSADDKKLLKNKKKLEKLIRKNEWYFKHIVSDVLKLLDKHGIKDIYMEDLNLQVKASFIKSEEFNVKYTRLIKLLRLSSIKNYMLEQSVKYGIRIHLTNPAFTSQQCSKCFHTERSNRDKDKFICKKCGHNEHSDINSPKSIKTRFNKELVDKLHIKDEHDRYIPKVLKRDTIKEMLIKEHNLLSKKQEILLKKESDPSHHRLDRSQEMPLKERADGCSVSQVVHKSVDDYSSVVVKKYPLLKHRGGKAAQQRWKMAELPFSHFNPYNLFSSENTSCPRTLGRGS